MPLYTIGFTRTTAEHFFTRLKQNGVERVLDVRLKNNSQLAAFARTPDIGYFLRELVGADYIHDSQLAPTEEILTAYRKKEIDWAGYETAFDRLMEERRADEMILERYREADVRSYCLLCSEEQPQNCHRRLVAERFSRLLGCEIIHL